MEFLHDYGLFLAKAITAVAAFAMVIAVLSRASTRQRGSQPEQIEVKRINDKFERMELALRGAMLPRQELRKVRRAERRRRKAERRSAGRDGRRRVFVLDFHGDIRGSAVSSLREEVTAVLTVARAEDEVVVRLESGGGMVHAYGLAASQLRRIRDAGIPLTVAVDKIAASGGYLMACVADRVLAAPFAIVGSIGVVSQIPNFHRLLRRHDIDFEQVTAGEFKRTITLFGETTEKAREKLRQEVEDTHELFKSFVAEQRPGLDLATVATGEYWLASRALDLQLVDELRTSDDYLVTRSRDADLFQVTYSARKGWMERLSRRVQTLLADRAGSDDDLPTPML
jgi:serine protease SohB